MAEPSDRTPNQEEFREENVQPREGNQQGKQNEGMPAETPKGPTVPEERTKKGKKRVTEEEIEDFESEEAYSNWRKKLCRKGVCGRKTIQRPYHPLQGDD